MIINGFKAGQLGNRLFHASQLMVLAIETDSTLVDFSFDDYKENFENLHNKPFTVFPQGKLAGLKYKLLQPLRNKVLHIRDFLLHRNINTNWLKYINQHGLEMNSYEELLNERKQYKNYIVEGWINKDLTPLHKYRPLLVDFFMPKREHVNNVKELIAKARQGADILVGIHIRRGDYKEFRNGEFYYDDDVYLNIMANMQAKYADKKIHYLICSNEAVTWENYRNYTVFAGNNQIIEDMYSLSYCDYIAGPISTYSMWASFIGQKPLYHIRSKDQVFDFNNFYIVADRSK